MIVGIGVDNVNIERFQAKLAGAPLLRERLFSPAERAQALRPEQLAARFAAKEALIKALGGGGEGFAFADITVTKDALGAPRLELAGPIGVTAQGLTLHLSMTHEHPLATAFVVAERG